MPAMNDLKRVLTAFFGWADEYPEDRKPRVFYYATHYDEIAWWLGPPGVKARPKAIICAEWKP